MSLSVGEIFERLYQRGIVPDGTTRKDLADALGYECRKGRVYRVGHGRYRAVWLPPTTTWRLQQFWRDPRRPIGADNVAERRVREPKWWADVRPTDEQRADLLATLSDEI